MSNFNDLIEVYTDDILESSNFFVIKSKLSKNDYINISDDVPFKDKLIVNKEYVILHNKLTGKVMMSNHETETYTNIKFLDNVKGDVIVFGLGIGLIILPLLNDDRIKSIDIIEIDIGLIEMISKKLAKYDINKKINIINADANEYHLVNKKLYDTIYFDIWYSVEIQTFAQIDTLHSNWNRFLKKGGWIDSWLSEKRKDYGI
jgi:spermidine synthase